MASAVIGALRVNLGIDSAEFQDGLLSAQASLKSVGKQMQSVGKSMSTYVTAPLVGFGALTLKVASDFEKGMNQVRAVSGATGEQFEALRQQAKELGATTQYTAAQAADAMGFLAMAGMDTNDILAAMPDTLQLAAAAQLDMASAADIVTNILAGYNRDVSQLGETTDVLVKAFTSANTDLRGLAEAMKYAGPVASAAGVDFNEAAAALSLMGNAGIQGSMAGTSLRGAISRILAPTKAMSGAMQEAGLSFTDTSGKLLPLADIIEQLEPHADNAGLFMELFGQRAGPAMAALVTQGSNAVRELTSSLDDSAGKAGEIAAVQMEGFSGAMLELKSAVEGLMIAISDSGLIEWATQAAKAMTGWVQEIAKTNPELLKWGTVIAAVAAGLGPLLIGLGLAATAIAAISAPVLLVVAGLASLAAAWAFWDDIKDAFPQTAAVIETALNVVGAVISHVMDQVSLFTTYLSQMFSGDLAGAADTVKAMFGRIGEAILQIVDIILPGFVDDLLALAGRVGKFADDILASFTSLKGQMIQIGKDIISGLWEGIQERWNSVKDGIANIGSSIATSVKERLGIKSPSLVMHQVGVDTMQGLANGMEEMHSHVAEVATGVAASVAGAVAGMMPTVDELAVQSEMERAALMSRLEQLRLHYEQGMLVKSEYDAMVEAAHQHHADRMVDITAQQVDQENQLRSQIIGHASSVFGSLSSIMQSFGEDNLAASKAFAVAQAIINTAQGITKALAQGGMLGFAGAAAVAAAGAAQISTIMSAQRGGGRRPAVRSSGPNVRESSSTTAPEVPRQTAVSISIPGGDFFSREQMERFVTEMLDMQRDGNHIVLKRV